MRRRPVAVLVGLALSARVFADGLAVVGATWIRASDPPLEDSVLVVEHDRIKAIGTRAEVPIPKGVVIVDGRGRYVAPAEGSAALAVGAAADFVVLDRDPRRGKSAYARPYRIVKGGRLVPARPEP